MPTPDELRSEIASARADFTAALEAAANRWETAPAAGDGEQSWSPRQVAEHIVGSELFYASEVCRACGYPGLELERPALAGAREALLAFSEASAKADGRLKYVTEKDLAMTHERMGTVADIIAFDARHLREHAQQIRSAVG